MEVGRGDGGGAAEAAAVEAAQVMERKKPAHVMSARCTRKVTEQIIVIIIRHYASAIPAFCPVPVCPWVQRSPAEAGRLEECVAQRHYGEANA